MTVESQNSFQLKGAVATLSGKPDIVATKGKQGLVLDAKTGMPKDSHGVQVLLYMWALPRYFKAKFSGVEFDGRVSYRTNHTMVFKDFLSDGFVSQFADMIHLLSGDTPPPKRPSETECRYCKITDEDCEERALLVAPEAVEVAEF